ncbi:hypothetical protein LCGC14_2786950 [marine sediment metagenome]|uniref:Homing endonuclease LAGLIDADG domain-containing protein n=1 Tax=marine sediment metagenome TaxID=412755 RepID=A0A0F9BI73_9ZZZZ
MKLTDIAWLAGLLEGEGCFRLNRGKYPTITLSMCDGDIVVRAATLMGAKINRSGNLWLAHINGAYAIQWMMTLYLFLGKRRREAVTEVIKFWKEYTYSHGSNGIRTMAKCHPDRVVAAFGLCHSCYMKQRRKEKRLLRMVG